MKAERTRKSATRYRINQEIKFQYAKKQRINEQLYRIHLECAYKWTTTWQMIQTVMDNNIQSQMEKQYANLNKKLDNLIKKRTENHILREEDDNNHFHTRVENLTNIRFNKEEIQLIKYGMKYSIERPTATYINNLIAETERAIRLLDTNIQNTYRFLATKKLKEIINTPGLTNILHKRQSYVLKTIKQI